MELKTSHQIDLTSTRGGGERITILPPPHRTAGETHLEPHSSIKKESWDGVHNKMYF